jgi:hypothetical protein
MDVMGGDKGPKRIHAVINQMVDYLKMESVKAVLGSDEQAKMRAVNTEGISELKGYRSEGRIMKDGNVMSEVMSQAI